MNNLLGLLLVMGVASPISITLWAWSLTQTSVANSTVLRNLTPVFTTFLGWLFLGHSFDATFLIGMAPCLEQLASVLLTSPTLLTALLVMWQPYLLLCSMVFTYTMEAENQSSTDRA